MTGKVKEQDFYIDMKHLRREAAIGGGGFGSVFKGRYQGRVCAIKIVRRALLDDEIVGRASSQEQVLMRLSQRHIAREV